MTDQLYINGPKSIEAGHRIMEHAGGAVFNPAGEICLARYVDDVLVGGVVYSNYSGCSIEMSTAGFGPRWVNRLLLWITFDYPFNQLRVKKLFVRVRASNTEAMRFDQHIGFKIEATLRDVYDDGDMHILSMYREDCRFLVVPRNYRHLVEGDRG